MQCNIVLHNAHAYKTFCHVLKYPYYYRYTAPDRVKPSFVIFDIRALIVRVPGCQKFTNGGLTRSGTGCLISGTHMATVDVKGLTRLFGMFTPQFQRRRTTNTLN